jgi:hypothetical protein
MIDYYSIFAAGTWWDIQYCPNIRRVSGESLDAGISRHVARVSKMLKDEKFSVSDGDEVECRVCPYAYEIA